MANWYAAHNFTPANDYSLQAVPDDGVSMDYTDLVTGDMAFVYADGFLRVFTYDSTSAATQDVPHIVTPDGNAGNGRWIEKDMFEAFDFYNGTFVEEFDGLVTSDGATVTLTVTSTGSGDLTAIFSSGKFTNTTGNTIALTAGSDTSPTTNYIYIDIATPQTMSKSTSGWPATEHVKVGFFLVPSATYVQSDGCYINQNWNDGTKEGNNGQLSHLGESIRLARNGATYHSGIAGNGATLDYITTAANVNTFHSTAGVCYQMHRHTVPAYSQSATDILFVNSNAGAYTPRADISLETVDANGGSLNNKYYNIVFWMVANKTGEYAPAMANMPTGSYVSLANAQNDVDGNDVYDMPREFNLDSSTGFLICRVTFRNQAGTITAQSTTDLRGRTPGTASGAVASGTTEFADNQFRVYDEADDTREIAFSADGITAGNTRTITMPDADTTLLTQTEVTDLTDGGDTTLHDHDGISENTAARHAESHTVASHSDTTATGTELETLTDGSDADALHYHAPQENVIINGDFNMWQRGTSFPALGSLNYTTDRWIYGRGTTGAVHTVSQDTDVPTVAESDHQSNYSLKLDCTTIDAVVDASDQAWIAHYIEGYDVMALMGQEVTLSFWVKATKTGIYCVGFTNSGNDRSYVSEYTVSSTDTWEYKTITLTMHAGDAGTWDSTNGIGLKIYFPLLAGSTYQTTADSWQTGYYFATSNQVNATDNTANNFLLSQVKFERGGTATKYVPKSFAYELSQCQRYFEKSYNYDVDPGTITGVGSNYNRFEAVTTQLIGFHTCFATRKRTTPTVVSYSPVDGASGKVYISGSGEVTAVVISVGESGFLAYGTGSGSYLTHAWTASAEL